MRIQDFSILQEVHYMDVFPKNFAEFISKYKAMPKSALRGLYVNFSTKSGDDDQTADDGPTGTYAFPIQYVLDYPADVWKAAHAKFVRVLKDKSTNKIALGRLHGGDVETILADVGIEDSDKVVKFVHHNFRPTLDGGNRLGKLLMLSLQTEIRDISDADSSWTMRSGKDQNEMLLSGGYDAIEDKSATAQRAALDKKAPEQIVFLTRLAYRVIETIALKRAVHDKSSPLTPDVSSSVESLVMSVAQGMRVGLKGDFRSHDGWSTVETTNGLSITIKLLKSKNRVGEKPHRELSEVYPYEIIVSVYGEHLDMESHYPAGTRFEKIAHDVAMAWNDGLQESSEDMMDDKLIEEASTDDLRGRLSKLNDLIANIKATVGERRTALRVKRKIEEKLPHLRGK